MSKRWYACKELYETECLYVSDILMVENVFIIPIQKKKLLPEEVILRLFGNIKMIINTHTKLLESLKEECFNENGKDRFEESCVGRVMTYYAPFLKIYMEYLHFQKNGNLILKSLETNKKFQRFLTTCKKEKQCRGLPLNSFLILPIQRIPRYELLFTQILKHTDSSHEDYPYLKELLLSIKTIAEQCNYYLQWEEDSEILLTLQKAISSIEIISPKRYMMRKYKAYIIDEEGNLLKKMIKLFLLNDLIIVTNDYDQTNPVQVKLVLNCMMYTYQIVESNESVLLIVSRDYRIGIAFLTKASAKEALGILHRNNEKSTMTCSICHNLLKGGSCCFCDKCGCIVCNSCGKEYYKYGHPREKDEYDDEESILCCSCYDYVRMMTQQNMSLHQAICSHNSASGAAFIHPVFPKIIMNPSDPNSTLPAGWGSAMLPDHKIYFFNVLSWVSSWSIPTDDFVNNAPGGWQQYYDENGKAFFYQAKEERIERESPSGCKSDGICSCCGYALDEVIGNVCPCCNSNRTSLALFASGALF